MHPGTTLAVPGHHRLTRVAAIAALTCATAGAAVVVIGDDQTGPDVRPPARSTNAFHDLQAYKAASMRALGRHLVAQRAVPGPRSFDLEANKARSARAR
jgi:hypothetical protein